MMTWTEFRDSPPEELLHWAEAQPWFHAMTACPQDPHWHAEGDVWTHTRMVCAELRRLADWSAIERGMRMKLVFAALLHDAGKPATTAPDPETRRLRSPKHALVGAALARQVLRELQCDLATREEIVALVRFHGRPPYFLEKPNPEHEVIRLSWLLNNRLLYLLALADNRGRKAQEKSRPDENIHLWKSTAEELDCFERPYPFSNEHARFLFYRGQLSSLHYTPHEDFRCTVTLMSGLPGAGKDTWLAKHRSGLPVVSLDAIREELDLAASDNQGRVIQAAREQCREHLRARRDFAFNATNVTRHVRQRWIDLFANYHARIEIVYLEPPLANLQEQNQRRTRIVPESVIASLLQKLEPPTATEGHGLLLCDGIPAE